MAQLPQHSPSLSMDRMEDDRVRVLQGMIGSPTFVAKAGSQELRGMAAFGQVQWELCWVGLRQQKMTTYNL